MSRRLYVSFWELRLVNLPEGRFQHRVIEAGEATAMIRAARTDKTLMCVSGDDLFAPHSRRERRHHEELRTVLADHYACPLVLADFLITSDNDGTAVQSVAPLELAELQPEDRLIIITCDYQLAEKPEARSDIEDILVLAADSVAFHLIACV
jgi:hypothetical protein